MANLVCKSLPNIVAVERNPVASLSTQHSHACEAGSAAPATVPQVPRRPRRGPAIIKQVPERLLGRLCPLCETFKLEINVRIILSIIPQCPAPFCYPGVFVCNSWKMLTIDGNSKSMILIHKWVIAVVCIVAATTMLVRRPNVYVRPLSQFSDPVLSMNKSLTVNTRLSCIVYLVYDGQRVHTDL